MRITSPAFSDGERIPKTYTEDGNNISPPLAWADLPRNTAELALIVDDPDAPRDDAFVHWTVYRIPAATPGLPENLPRGVEELREPAGAAQGRTSFGKHNVGYRGPAPPKGHGVHHYHFRLYALDEPLVLAAGVERSALDAAMRGHILGSAELVATYERA
ncbi:MAG: YbhB/YbcL family Raf kinase inhibitor-like protein [Phycisphaeraceae bacterium]